MTKKMPQPKSQSNINQQVNYSSNTSKAASFSCEKSTCCDLENSRPTEQGGASYV